MYATFECFLQVAAQALSGATGEALLQTMKGLNKASPFFEIAVGELMYRGLSDYQDILGLCYMSPRSVDRSLGQFFTSWSAARLIAEVISGEITECSHSTRDKIYVLDSACGSGVMLLTVADALPKNVLTEKRIVFAGLDIDPLCVLMTKLNLRLHGLFDEQSIVKSEGRLTEEDRGRLGQAIRINRG